jgi:acyl-CoA thioester hydrolase
MPAFVTHRGSVNAWECDENDHLNVRFFVAKANEGLPFVLSEMGHTPAALEAMGARARIRMQHMRFLREARKATPLTVAAGIVASAPLQLSVYSEIRHSLTGAVLATVLTDVEVISRRDGSPCQLRAPPAALRCEVPPHGAPRGLPADGRLAPPEPGALAQAGFLEIARGRVRPTECDPDGELEPFQYVGRIADGVVNLMARFQTEEELSRRSHGIEGGALLELRIAHHAPLRAGGLFTVHSGLRAVRPKTIEVVHLVLDEETRSCAAACEGVAVSMDLRTRKAIEIPDLRRRRMEAGVIKAAP